MMDDVIVKYETYDSMYKHVNERINHSDVSEHCRNLARYFSPSVCQVFERMSVFWDTDKDSITFMEIMPNGEDGRRVDVFGRIYTNCQES